MQYNHNLFWYEGYSKINLRLVINHALRNHRCDAVQEQPMQREQLSGGV